MSIEKYADNLGPPAIKLDGLQIWVHGRQYPKEEDYWDGNWLNVTAHVEAKVPMCGRTGISFMFLTWLAGLSTGNNESITLWRSKSS